MYLLGSLLISCYIEKIDILIYSIIKQCYFLNDNSIIIIIIDKVIQHFICFLWDLLGPSKKMYGTNILKLLGKIIFSSVST